MKKIMIVTVVFTLLVSSFTACSKQPDKETSSGEVTESSRADSSLSSVKDSENASSAESGSEEAKTLEGTLSEKKDFMYIVTDKDNNAYVFPIDEEHPTDLTGMEAGDKVILTYTGTLNLTDNFTGEILSIKKM